MKKILLLVGLAVGLVSTSEAQNRFYGDFLAGSRYVWVTNNTTYNYNDTSVPYLNGRSNYVFALTNLYQSNGITFTNATAGALVITNTSTYFPPAWQDIDVPADRNGNAEVGLALGVVYTPYTTNTNSVTFTLARLVPVMSITGGTPTTNWVAGSYAFDRWSVALTNSQTSLNPIAALTNLPAAFVQGASKLRLQKIVVGDNAASGAFINSVRLQGYQP